MKSNQGISKPSRAITTEPCVGAASGKKRTRSDSKQETERSPTSYVGEMIRTAAYFRAERRGFAAGAELQDWYEAEQEIQRMRNRGDADAST